MLPADTTSMNSDEMVLETEAFARMHKLKLLHLSHVQLNGSYAEFPTELRWLCWHEFSLNSIPINFPLENLVVLEMHHSCLRRVWKGTKVCYAILFLILFFKGSHFEHSILCICKNELTFRLSSFVFLISLLFFNSAFHR